MSALAQATHTPTLPDLAAQYGKSISAMKEAYNAAKRTGQADLPPLSINEPLTPQQLDFFRQKYENADRKIVKIATLNTTTETGADRQIDRQADRLRQTESDRDRQADRAQTLETENKRLTDRLQVLENQLNTLREAKGETDVQLRKTVIEKDRQIEKLQEQTDRQAKLIQQFETDRQADRQTAHNLQAQYEEAKQLLLATNARPSFFQKTAVVLTCFIGVVIYQSYETSMGLEKFHMVANKPLPYAVALACSALIGLFGIVLTMNTPKNEWDEYELKYLAWYEIGVFLMNAYIFLPSVWQSDTTTWIDILATLLYCGMLPFIEFTFGKIYLTKKQEQEARIKAIAA